MVEDRPGDLETVDQLTRCEHLLIWAMRAIALGHEDCPTLMRTFRHVCGARGDQVLQAYTIFIKYLAMAAPRRLRVHVPGCLCVGLDEAAALTIIAAGQRSLRERSEARLRRTLGELIGGPLDESLVLVVQGVAGLMAACDLALSDRTVERGARGAEVAASPVHPLH